MESQECGTQIMLKILQEHQATWVRSIMFKLNLAPEVMCRQNHGVAVDYFAVGVIGYECMYGKRPYVGKNRKEIRDHILSKQVQIRRNEVPPGWSLEAADFINKLI